MLQQEGAEPTVNKIMLEKNVLNNAITKFNSFELNEMDYEKADNIFYVYGKESSDLDKKDSIYIGIILELKHYFCNYDNLIEGQLFSVEKVSSACVYWRKMEVICKCEY